MNYVLPSSLAFVLSLSLIAVNTHVATAQDVTKNACLDTMHQELMEEDLFYRAVLFGQSTAELAEVGAVRFDGSGNPWLKTKENEWKAIENTTTRGDSAMEADMSPRPRRGIFETKQAMTSELLPEILQSMRALQCRLRAVCGLVTRSQDTNAGDTISVEIDGCITQSFNRIDSCRSQQVGDTTLDVSIASVQVGVCEAAVQAILDRESNELAAVLSYDTSYRTLLQIGGIVSNVSTALQGSVLDVLPSMVKAATAFEDLPCFSAQCDQ